MRHSILVVEDEPNIVESLSFLMESSGLRVRVAYDGAAALQMIDDDRPDLLLLDIMIPARDGFEVLEAVRANPAYADMRVIMLTAKGREADRRRAMDLGIDDYVTKPFSTRDVVHRVKAVLEAEKGHT